MICIPLNFKRFPALIANLPKAQKVGDIVELWLESISSLSSAQITKIFKTKKRPFLLKFSGNLELLNKLKGYPLDYIDIDLHAAKKLIPQIRTIFPSAHLIISHHDFVKTPSEEKLRGFVKMMQNAGADIKKIAVMANTFEDSLLLLSLAKELSGLGQKVIFIGMGKNGTITRTAGHLCGNYLMYCPLSEIQKTAPGQITANELRKIMELTN